jgi:hypothetical protein
MPIRRIAVAAILAAALAALPLTPVRAQYYPPCNPFPLSWPFCIAGAAVGTAAAIATAPFAAVAGGPYYYYGQPYYAASTSYPRRHRRWYAGYYGSGYEPWNRPSPSDHVARELNRQELARTYYGY